MIQSVNIVESIPFRFQNCPYYSTTTGFGLLLLISHESQLSVETWCVLFQVAMLRIIFIYTIDLLSFGWKEMFELSEIWLSQVSCYGIGFCLFFGLRPMATLEG